MRQFGWWRSSWWCYYLCQSQGLSVAPCTTASSSATWPAWQSWSHSRSLWPGCFSTYSISGCVCYHSSRRRTSSKWGFRGGDELRRGADQRPKGLGGTSGGGLTRHSERNGFRLLRRGGRERSGGDSDGRALGRWTHPSHNYRTRYASAPYSGPAHRRYPRRQDHPQGHRLRAAQHMQK